MKKWIFLFLLIATPVYAQSFTGGFIDFGSTHASSIFTATDLFTGGVLTASDITVQLALMSLSASSASVLNSIDDNSIVRGDGGGNGIQGSTSSIADDGTMTVGGTQERVSGTNSFVDFDDGGAGTVTIGGSGGTNNENIFFDFETESNTVKASSITAVSSFEFQIPVDAVSQAPANVPMTLKGSAGQTGDMLNINDSDGSNLFEVTSTGRTIIEHSLQIGPNSSTSFSGEGDVYVNDTVKAEGGIYAEAKAYGAAIEALDNEHAITYTNIMYGDATLTAATQTITDTHASFDSTYLDQFLRVVSSTPSFKGATGEIIGVLSSTEVVVSFGTAGGDSIVDATGMSFVIYPHPNFFVGDNGDIHASIGVNEDASFKINTEDSNNEHAVHFVSTSGTDFNRGLDIDIDADGYNVGTGMAVNYNSGPLEDGDTGGGIFVTLNDGEIVAASSATVLGAMAMSTTTHSDAIKRGLVVLPGFTEALVVQGATAENPDYGYEVTSGSEADRVNGVAHDGTAFLETSMSDLTIFDNDNDYILIGDDNTFEDIEVNLVTGGRRSINPLFYYPNAGDGTWVALPIQGDGTNGFQSGGDIVFNAPGDWTKDDEDMDGNAITDAYYVAIQRTRNNLNNKPVEDHFKIFASQDTGAVITGVGAMKPIGKAADPCGDTTQYPTGSMFYNSTDNYPCFCDEGGNDRKMTDAANCF